MSFIPSNEIISDNSSVLVIDLITKLQNQRNQGNYQQKDHSQDLNQFSKSPFATFYPTKYTTGILHTKPDFTTSRIDIIQYLVENPDEFASIIIISSKKKYNIFQTYIKRRIGWVLNKELSIPIFVLQSDYGIDRLFSDTTKSLHMGIFIQELPEEAGEFNYFSFYSVLQSVFKLKTSIYKLTNLPMTTPYSSIQTSTVLQSDRDKFYSYIKTNENLFDKLVQVKYLLNHNNFKGIAHSIENDKLDIILTEFKEKSPHRFGYNRYFRSLKNLDCGISITRISS